MPLEDIEFCEVYYPTMAEFQDFYSYVEKLSETNKTGIVKVKILRLILLTKDYSSEKLATQERQIQKH